MDENQGDSAATDPLPLRKRYRLAAVTIGLLVFVPLALLIPVPFVGRTATALGDLVHAPLFGSLTLIALTIWQRVRPLREESPAGVSPLLWRLVLRGLVACSTLSLFGLLMEFLQSGTGRSASLHDALANTLGCIAALAGYVSSWWARSGRRPMAVAFGMASAAILFFAWLRPGLILADVVLIRSDFPLLASFESPAEMTRWYFRNIEAVRVRKHATDGNAALRVDFEDLGTSAITLTEMVSDWSDYSVLRVDAMLDENSSRSELGLKIRVVSEFESDFRAFVRTERLVRGEETRIEIPLVDFLGEHPGETLETRRVRYVDFVPVRDESEDTGEKARVYFDQLILRP